MASLNFSNADPIRCGGRKGLLSSYKLRLILSFIVVLCRQEYTSAQHVSDPFVTNSGSEFFLEKRNNRTQNTSIIPDFHLEVKSEKLRIKSEFCNKTKCKIIKKGIWAIWWDKKYGNKKYRKDAAKMIRILNEIRKETKNEMDMKDPPNIARGFYYNVYIHHGEDDLFPNWWENFQRTDRYGNPYLTLPSPYHTDKLNLAHEGFHVFQYQSNSPGFEYYGDSKYGDSKWYIESSAKWFASSKYPKETNAFLEAGAIEANPHLALWHYFDNAAPGNTATMHTLLFYITEVFKIDRDVLTSGFYSNVDILPQEYIYKQAGGRKFRTAFADWAAHNVADFDYLTRAQVQIARAITEYVGDKNNFRPYVKVYTGNNIPVKNVSPSGSLLPRGWSYNVVKVNNLLHSTYKFIIKGEKFGSEGALSRLEGRIVIVGDTTKFLNVKMKNNVNGKIQVSVDDSDKEIYLIVAATPNHYTGNQKYGYSFTIEHAFEKIGFSLNS